ncbi:WD40-repeat-containing domain protein [Entophlyctis helioformis]|nr:WD40-repeat-containing domain protein [Entophlyctis helioformis]
MASPDVHQLLVGIPITCHAFNADRSQVAISPNNNEVHIYSRTPGGGWTLAHVLPDHDKLVTCIDWAPTTNRIVTCSQDRNAYVWTWDGASAAWKPTLVLLRINRAATFVRWSPHENKFAVASGARLISVCYFESENNWWVSKHIKKPIRSTVLSLDWHPENILLVAGSSDMHARVFSAWIKGIDAKASNPVWGEKLPFGTVCGDFAAGGWVHAVGFSPSGNSIAFAAHDSTITIANGPAVPPQLIVTPNLPFVSLFYASENTIVVAGHDCAPYVVLNRGSHWELADKIDAGRKKSVTGNSAFDKFRQMDSRGQAATDVEINTTHQNTITSVRPFAGERGAVAKFTSTGVDGKLVIWDLLSAGIAGLRI